MDCPITPINENTYITIGHRSSIITKGVWNLHMKDDVSISWSVFPASQVWSSMWNNCAQKEHIAYVKKAYKCKNLAFVYFVNALLDHLSATVIMFRLVTLSLIDRWFASNEKLVIQATVVPKVLVLWLWSNFIIAAFKAMYPTGRTLPQIIHPIDNNKKKSVHGNICSPK